MDDDGEFEDNDKDNKSNSGKDERCFLERFFKKHRQHQSRKSEPMLSYWKLNN